MLLLTNMKNSGRTGESKEDQEEIMEELNCLISLMVWTNGNLKSCPEIAYPYPCRFGSAVQRKCHPASHRFWKKGIQDLTELAETFAGFKKQIIIHSGTVAFPFISRHAY